MERMQTGNHDETLLRRAAARTWALAGGKATEVDGRLIPAQTVDTVGLAVIEIGNSEEPAADLRVVYDRIAGATKGLAVLSYSVLLEMTEAANARFPRPGAIS